MIKLAIPPEKEYISAAGEANSMADIKTFASITTKAILLSKEHIAIIITMLPSPSFIPGIGSGIGKSDSMYPNIKAVAVNNAVNVNFFVFMLISIPPPVGGTNHNFENKMLDLSCLITQFYIIIIKKSSVKKII